MKYIIFSFFAFMSLGVSAQDLHTEITVDRTVLPKVREASRLKGIVPSITQPSTHPSTLTPAEYNNPGDISSDVSTLPPISWHGSTEHTPYRGYISAGYFPIYNLGANAGYRFLDIDNAQAGAWVQFNGNSYHGDIPHFDDALFTNNTVRGGVSGFYDFSAHSTLKVSFIASDAVTHTPFYVLRNDIERRRSYDKECYMLNPKAEWSGLIGNFYMSLGAGWQRFVFNDDIAGIITDDGLKDVRQSALDASFKFGVCREGESLPWIGVNADITSLKSNNIFNLSKGAYLNGSMIEGHVLPYVRMTKGNFTGHIGALVSIAGGEGEQHIKLAPEVLVEWGPANGIRLFAHAHGGEHINRMSDIFDYNPYIYPAISYQRTDMPLVVEGGASFGPFSGFEMEINGGYALARKYLIPIININSEGHMYSTMLHADFNSWNAGAKLRYSYESIATLEAAFKTGGSDISAASWYGWRDAAKWLFDVSLRFSPIKPLDITVGFSSRASRKATQIEYPYEQANAGPAISFRNIGNISNVHLQGSYRVSERITAFLSIENLLNNRYYLISGMPAQGVSGLLGGVYKF